MILYLTSNARINLLDFLEEQQGIPLKKLTGSFSFLSFVIKDMRHFAHAHYVVLDRDAITESDSELLEALLSYLTIYDRRVLIIAEGLPIGSPFISQLVQAGIYNIVTATEIKAIREELQECFTEDGMQRFSPAAFIQHVENEPQMDIQEENVRYNFTCSNLIIAVAGCDRRVGVTTTAMNLVCWINAHGGTACYVEANTNNHLAHIIQLFEPEKTGNAYTLAGSDFYMTKELNHDYNFIVLDCGVLGEQRIQEDFKSANLRILCGSAMPYELVNLYRAIQRCNPLSVQPIGLFVPENLKNYLINNIRHDILFGENSHDLFNITTNNNLHETLLQTSIYC
ncbi:hypothetical protein [Paenibacillus luteus]|uniref:hypothetical protein n=1 Tax=Paenibacillus luteus TaxID=2545753 RepID=UPI001F4FDF08|nr:hypothetical protein [Paenibacillus luteus]